MKVFLANIAEVKPEHIDLLPPDRAQKARRFRFPADRARCVAAGLLLRRFLPGEEIYTDEYGKPRAKGGTCFNLSHSGEWVTLAVGGGETGCDIERHRQVEALRMGRVVFTDRELTLISESPDRLGAFYRIWTKKEALLKAIGRGFGRAAKTVDVCGETFAEDGDIYRMNTIAFADYTISVCEKNGAADIGLERVHL